MDLVSGDLYWPQLATAPVYPRLERDRRCDVAIVGGGVTGALCGYYLARAGLDVVLLDRRNVARGSTPASTGLLQYEVDVPLVELIDLVGRETAERSYRLGVEALETFDRLIAELGDDCGFRRRPSLFLADQARDAPMLAAEGEARRAIGITVDLLSADELHARFGIQRCAALLSRDAAEVDPNRLTIRLIDRAIDAGLTVHGDTEVIRYEPGAGAEGVANLVTAHGPTVRARHVVYATGYETRDFFDPGQFTLKTTYALVTEPVGPGRHWADDCLIWETGTPYFYARTTGDGRIVLGGEDDPFIDAASREAALPGKVQTLLRKMREMFPSLRLSSAAAWAGVFAETPDGLPYIGAHPRFPGAWFALGYGGNGITFSLIAARIICDQLTGVANPDASRFGFDRRQTR